MNYVTVGGTKPYKPKYPFSFPLCKKGHAMIWLCVSEFNPCEHYCMECEGLLKKDTNE